MILNKIRKLRQDIFFLISVVNLYSKLDNQAVKYAGGHFSCQSIKTNDIKRLWCILFKYVYDPAMKQIKPFSNFTLISNGLCKGIQRDFTTLHQFQAVFRGLDLPFSCLRSEYWKDYFISYHPVYSVHKPCFLYPCLQNRGS